ADARKVRRHLLPQRGDLLRRAHPGADMAALHAAAAGARRAVHRAFRAGERPGRPPAGDHRAHRLSTEGRAMTVKVLIVDDSATMRSLIAAALRQDPEIEVLGFANDPIEAREAIKRLNPDVVTLDVEMPHMNGLDFLEKI